MTESRSRTQLPQPPSLLINGILITSEHNLKLLGVALDSNLTFKMQIRNMAPVISSKLVIIRVQDFRRWHCSKMVLLFYSASFWVLFFCVFTCPRVIFKTRLFVLLIILNFSCRTSIWILVGIVGILGLLYKIANDNSHYLFKFLPDFYQPARITRISMALNSMTF